MSEDDEDEFAEDDDFEDEEDIDDLFAVTPEPRTPPTSASVGDGGRRGFF